MERSADRSRRRKRRSPARGGAGLLGIPWGGTSDGEGSTITLLGYAFSGFRCQAFCLTAAISLAYRIGKTQRREVSDIPLRRLFDRRGKLWLDEPEPCHYAKH